MIDPPVAGYTGGRPGYSATAPGRGQKLNPNRSRRRALRGISRFPARRSCRARRREEDVRLSLRVQRILGEAHARAGCRRQSDSRRDRCGRDARDSDGHGNDPRLPRVDRAGKRSVGDWHQRRKRHHRRCRFRYLAGKPELQRPHRRRPERTERKTLLSTDSRLARQVCIRGATAAKRSTRACAIRN